MEGALGSWLVSLIGGAVGGNVAGFLNKSRSLGPLFNTILGAVGGAAGGQLLPRLIEGLQGMSFGGNAGLSAVVGLLLPLIVSFFKKK